MYIDPIIIASLLLRNFGNAILVQDYPENTSFWNDMDNNDTHTVSLYQQFLKLSLSKDISWSYDLDLFGAFLVILQLLDPSNYFINHLKDILTDSKSREELSQTIVDQLEHNRNKSLKWKSLWLFIITSLLSQFGNLYDKQKIDQCLTLCKNTIQLVDNDITQSLKEVVVCTAFMIQ
ncbi:hypothetical protein RFI_03543 [Reticulomyxa filosa]|uniref:Uncharacterized protein n=1 Tax=Reticulomyxa filosa TaxID=46433 RepID=X6P611_RETFI|nr:hypothetical protein RFI_03543 [Reticulomyxa filosa]|eukprot:ETO33558.1 hypothetical protein RFI_03543 [Reticulomyxa filosa]